MDGDKPFYEYYQFLNDSTIEITSYKWTGTDSTGSTKSYLQWKDGAYYLGDDHANYKVTDIEHKAILMMPNLNASNTVS